ncbi:ATP-binding cassette domain-containing protein, partial [Enterococcus faecium]|uniref:ATP-binding cassette domain-containing protein n=1 Tax=Enterococcus faecium TaxID=1352 RepID=UPI00317062F6
MGVEEIYEDAEFHIGVLDNAGIVVANGAGKTTLFRLLLGELELDNGSPTSGNARNGYLPQEIVLADEDITVWDFLFEGRTIKKYAQELEDIYKKLETAVNAEQEA